MKRVRNVIATAASLLALASVPSAQPPLGATDVSAKEVQEFMKRLPPGVVTDRPIRVVDVGGYRVGGLDVGGLQGEQFVDGHFQFARRLQGWKFQNKIPHQLFDLSVGESGMLQDLLRHIACLSRLLSPQHLGKHLLLFILCRVR